MLEPLRQRVDCDDLVRVGSVWGPCGVRAGSVRAKAPNPQKLRLGEKVPHRETNPRTATARSRSRQPPERRFNVDAPSAAPRFPVPTGALPARPTYTADMPSSIFIRWSLVGRGVRMAPAHCPFSEAWVGRWHRRHSRAMAGIATCAHASATGEPLVARPFVTKICGTQSKVEVKKDRASRFSSLASIAIARDMRGASRRALAAKGEKWRADRPCTERPSRTPRARKLSSRASAPVELEQAHAHNG
jgi:hypothetical protein